MAEPSIAAGPPIEGEADTPEVAELLAAYPELLGLIRAVAEKVPGHFGPGAHIQLSAPYDPDDDLRGLCITVRAPMDRRELRQLRRSFNNQYRFDLRPEAHGILTIDTLPE